MDNTDLAPGLWTAEDICDIYRRLLQWCADHPDESTPRLEQLYRDRLAKHERLAREELAARMAAAQQAAHVADVLAWYR